MKRITLALLALVFTTNLWAEGTEGDRTKKGQMAPDFTITNLDGEVFRLSDMKGKVVLVNFFATWCGPCMEELPELEKQVWPRFKNENFKLISIGREHTNSELKKFKSKKQYTFPIAADPKRQIYARYAEKFIPRNYIIDKEGKIIFQAKGFSQKELDEMIIIIEKALNK